MEAKTYCCKTDAVEIIGPAQKLFPKSRPLPTPQASDWRTKRTSKSWRGKKGINASLGNPEFWEQHADEIEQARAKINYEGH